MPNAAGSRHQLLLTEESTWGTTPTTPAQAAVSNVRHTSCTVGLTKATIQSQELRSDRQIADMRHGLQNVSGDIGVEYSFKAHDSLIESAFFQKFAQASTTVDMTGLALTVTIGPVKFKRGTGNFGTDGITVGDLVYITGPTLNAGNVGAWQVTAISTTTTTNDTITVTPLQGQTAVAEGPIASCTVGFVVKGGTTPRYWSLERGFLDQTAPTYLNHKGCMVNGMSLSLKPNAMITGGFSFIGREQTSLTTSFATNGYTPAASNAPYDTFSGAIYEGGYGSGQMIAYVTGLDLSFNNNLEANLVVGTNIASGVTAGRFAVTGKMDAFFPDKTLLDKFVNETESKLMFSMGSGSKYYTFILPRIKYTSADTPVNGEGAITQGLGFQALYDATTGTAIMCARMP